MIRLDSICGVEYAKRACEVALAGEHSILFIGAHDSQAQDLAEFVRSKSLETEQSYYALAITPCPCGNYGSVRECTCTAEMIARWQAEHFPSCPLDITIEVQLPDTYKLLAWVADGFRCGEPDESMIARVTAAHNDNEVAGPDDTGMSLLKVAIMQLQLGPRQVESIISVATTIARLAGSDSVHTAYLVEATQYRPSKKY